ncbi:MAG: acylphosphatase [Patescibacteria group bacterium]
MKHFNLRISGLVQGVGFRFFASQKADFLNLTGFIKNNPDGTVSIEIEGGEKNLKEFITWCRKGPPTAEVKKLEVKEGKLKNFSEFKYY